ncbi:MAG TPA: DUF4405 domain-containing protein [Lacipirellulaceae bacterium]|nr:DUF4405 domain-containing protein [Lacipirellulaceae bacterium]HMP06419.1 DUF4405 domain-containing protein [Lacipirellulaceae bacterium]
MTKTEVNFWLDAVLLVLFSLLCWAAVVVRFVFPPGPMAAEWVLWGWGYQQWANLQFGLLCALAAAVLLHVMLHWSWVCGVVSSKLRQRATAQSDGSRTLWGVALLLVVVHAIAAGTAAAALCVQGPQ